MKTVQATISTNRIMTTRESATAIVLVTLLKRYEMVNQVETSPKLLPMVNEVLDGMELGTIKMVAFVDAVNAMFENMTDNGLITKRATR